MWDLLVSIPDHCLSFYCDNCTMYSIVEWFCSHSNDFSCMSVLSCRSVTRKKIEKVRTRSYVRAEIKYKDTTSIVISLGKGEEGPMTIERRHVRFITCSENGFVPSALTVRPR